MISTCYCGTAAAAVCPRCSEPRCAVHHIISVWWDDTGQRWAAEKPNGSQWQDWLGDIDPEQKGILTSEHVYPRAYSEGGPGCQQCRTRAADVAVAEIHAAVERFAQAGLASDLKIAADGADVLSEAEVAALARKSASLAPAKIDLVTINLSLAAAKRRFGRGVGPAVQVAVVSRTPIAWFPSAKVAVDPGGIFLRGSGRDVIYDRDMHDLRVLIETSGNISVSYNQGGHRGSDSSPGSTPFGTLTSGTMPVEVRRDRLHGENRYTYIGVTLRPTLQAVALAVGLH